MQVRTTLSRLQGDVDYSQIELHRTLEYRGGNQKSQMICQTGLEL